LEGIEARLSVCVSDSPSDLPRLLADATNGACLFSGQELVLVEPPFPVWEDAVFTGCHVSPLLEIMQRHLLIAVVLVRLGSYAVGVYRGEEPVSTKVGTGLVHGRHRQGGSSSARFRRRRENQANEFLDRVCEKAKEHIGPHAGQLDHVVFGGARTTIESLLKLCPVLERLQDRALAPLLDIPDPRQYVLESSIRRVWSSRITEWSRAPV
jgi:peptide subunit release factor 1 (eRF1)